MPVSQRFVVTRRNSCWITTALSQSTALLPSLVISSNPILGMLAWLSTMVASLAVRFWCLSCCGSDIGELVTDVDAAGVTWAQAVSHAPPWYHMDADVITSA